MAIAKVTAIELRQGDDITVYAYNERGTCVRIFIMKNTGKDIAIYDKNASSKMPFRPDEEE